MESAYKRVLIKLSGEALAGEAGHGICDEILTNVAAQIKTLVDFGVEVGIVVGGGNFWRGRIGNSIAKSSSHYMGMLATVMNSIALRDALDRQCVDCVLMSAVDIPKIGENVNDYFAKKYLQEKKVVIFAGGTGSTFFTTDSAAVLRGVEIDADVILFAKNIDGVYSDDPNINPQAIKYDSLTYDEIIQKRLKVMDLTAATMCIDNQKKIIVFELDDKSNILDVVKGTKMGTVLHP